LGRFTTQDEVHHVVDLVLGGEPAEPEADRRMGEVVPDAHGMKHVRRLQARAGARRTARHRDILDGHHERLALDEAEGYVEVAGEAMRERAIDLNGVELAE